QKAWVGLAYSRTGQGDPCPYAIVPIFDSQTGTRNVKALIRVIAFDSSRSVTGEDLSKLQLQGEQLCKRMPQFTEASYGKKAPQQDLFDKETVLVAHSQRLTRRKCSRILGSNYTVLEADTGDKALEILGNNRVNLVLLDTDFQDTSGYA